MGAVFLARDRASAQEVAIKVLLPELSGEAQHLQRFRREAEVAGLIAHPHVVDTLTTGVEPDGTPWIAMELIRGQTLSSYMRERGTLPVPEAVALVRQIVSGIGGAYEVGIVHRDLKPGNVLVRDNGGRLHAKVVDFGLARFIDTRTYEKLTATGLAVGTPTYMSPEQAFAEDVDIRTDIYAIGAIMHALVTGEPPFGRGPAHDVLPRLLAYERTRLTETRRDLGPVVEVIERCLEPEPDQRYQTPAELDAALAPLDDSKGKDIEPWRPPETLQTLALAPDPILDAPKPRTRPMPAAKPRVPPPDAVTDAKPEETDAPERSGRTRLVMALLLVSLAGIGSAVTVLMMHASSPTPSSESPAAAPSIAQVQPVALVVDARAADPAPADSGAGEEAPLERASQPVAPHRQAAAGAIEVAPEEGEPESASMGYPVDITIEVRESPVPPSRFRQRLLEKGRRLAFCVEQNVHRPGVAYDGLVSYRPHGAQLSSHYQPALPAALDQCRSALNGVIRQRPTGDGWSFDVHLRAAVIDGPGTVRVVDATSWSSRTLTAPHLSVTLTVVSGDVRAAQLQRTLAPRTAFLSRCLENAGALPSRGPWEGTLIWQHLLAHTLRLPNGTPYAIDSCLNRAMAYELTFPHPLGEPLETRLHIEAAPRTSIRVVEN